MGIENRNISRTVENVYPSKPAGMPVGKNKKQGRGFFLTLLIVSGIIILFLAAFGLKGKEIHIFTFQKFVINKAFVSLLPQEYTLEEAEAVRGKVYNFYETAYHGGIADSALFEVSSRIRNIMGDDRISNEEVQSLLRLIDEKAEKK